MSARFHPDARAEYVDALLYIEARRQGYGSKFEDAVAAVLDRANAFPGSGVRWRGPEESVQNLDLRVFPLLGFPYSVVVGFEAGELTVFAVAHQHREPGYWRARMK